MVEIVRPDRGRYHLWEAQMGAIPSSSRFGHACSVTHNIPLVTKFYGVSHV